jgi:hypothetical protein
MTAVARLRIVAKPGLGRLTGLLGCLRLAPAVANPMRPNGSARGLFCFPE